MNEEVRDDSGDKLIDVQAAWRAMPANVQEQLGMAAIVRVLAVCDGSSDWIDAACHEADRVMAEGVRDHAVSDGATRPDLSCLGVQACRQCGCTDACGCEEGCSWIETDLCSACAERASVA